MWIQLSDDERATIIACLEQMEDWETFNSTNVPLLIHRLKHEDESLPISNAEEPS